MNSRVCPEESKDVVDAAAVIAEANDVVIGQDVARGKFPEVQLMGLAVLQKSRRASRR